MDRLTKNNYQDDLFEFQATKKVRVDEYTEISYKQHNYNEDLWKAVKEKEDLEEKIGCPLEVFMKLHEINGLYCEIEIALSSFPSKTVYLEIDKLGLDGIHFKKNKYELYFIEYKYYKVCFWLKEDKSE